MTTLPAGSSVTGIMPYFDSIGDSSKSLLMKAASTSKTTNAAAIYINDGDASTKKILINNINKSGLLVMTAYLRCTSTYGVFQYTNADTQWNVDSVSSWFAGVKNVLSSSSRNTYVAKTLADFHNTDSNTTMVGTSGAFVNSVYANNVGEQYNWPYLSCKANFFERLSGSSASGDQIKVTQQLFQYQLSPFSVNGNSGTILNSQYGGCSVNVPDGCLVSVLTFFVAKDSKVLWNYEFALSNRFMAKNNFLLSKTGAGIVIVNDFRDVKVY